MIGRKIMFGAAVVLASIFAVGTGNKAETGMSQADNNGGLQIGVSTREAPQEALHYLESVAGEIVAREFHDPSAFDLTDFSYDDVKVMEPYSSRRPGGAGGKGEYEYEEAYLFPVVSNNAVQFTIGVFSYDGEWTYSVDNDLRDELTALIGADSCYQIYRDYGENFNKCEEIFVESAEEMSSIEGRSVTIENNEPMGVLLDLSGEPELYVDTVGA